MNAPEQIRILREALSIAADRLDWAEGQLDKPSRSQACQRIGKQCKYASEIARSTLAETKSES